MRIDLSLVVCSPLIQMYFRSDPLLVLVSFHALLLLAHTATKSGQKRSLASLLGSADGKKGQDDGKAAGKGAKKSAQKSAQKQASLSFAKVCVCVSVSVTSVCVCVCVCLCRPSG